MRTERIVRKGSFPAKRPLFYYITGRKQLRRISLLSCIQRAIRLGVDFVQIREKDLDDRELFRLTCSAVELARGTAVRIIVNGRADIALAAGAHGVHLPSTGLEVRDIRTWVPRSFLAGVSVHTVSEIRRAYGQGADYVLMGHVFPTESKEGLGRPVGLGALKRACAEAQLPVFGLGGITRERIPSVLETGAAGIAAISLFQQEADFR